MPYLTPDVDVLSESPDCRKISVSGDLWLYVSGALNYLSQSWNWEQYGTATPDEMADYFKDVLDDYVLSSCGGGMENISTAWNQIIDKSSGNGDSPTSIILQTSLPAEAQGCKGILVYFNWSANKNMAAQLSTQGNKANGFVTLLDPTGNGTMQMIVPMDDIGGKIVLSAVGGLDVWTIDVFLVSWWF